MAEWGDAWCAFSGPSGGLCALRLEAHHCVPKATIKGQYTYWHGLTEQHRRTRQLPEVLPPPEDALADRRNLLPICSTHHELVTNHRIYVSRDMLPAGIDAFAAELGLTWYLDRFFDQQDPGPLRAA